MNVQTDQLKHKFETLKLAAKQQSEQIKLLKSQVTDPAQPLQKFIEQVVPVFAQMIDMRIGIDVSNSNKIARLARKIALKLELDRVEVNDIYHAGWLHNIGMIGLKDDVITTPYNSLTKEQKKDLDSSPLKAEALLISIPQFHDLAHILRHQYERFDGKGYPDKLYGDEVPIGSLVLSVAVDFYELQNGIFFGEPVSSEEAFEYIKNGAGKNYSPVVVDAFESIAPSLIGETVGINRELSLKCSDVTEGMMLTENLMMDGEIILLSSGQILTETLIDRLHNLEKKLGKNFVFHVEIHAEENEIEHQY